MTRRKIYVKGRPPAPDPDGTKKLLPGGGAVTPPIGHRTRPATGGDTAAVFRTYADYALSRFRQPHAEASSGGRTFFTVAEVASRPSLWSLSAREYELHGTFYDTRDGTTGTRSVMVIVSDTETRAVDIRDILTREARSVLGADVVFWKVDL